MNAVGTRDADVCQALVWGTPGHGRRHLSWQQLADFVEQRRAGWPRARYFCRHDQRIWVLSAVTSQRLQHSECAQHYHDVSPVSHPA